jgi:hypothetical protein
MAKKVWVVTRVRHTADDDSFIILGVYEEFGDAVARVDEAFIEDEEMFEEYYSAGIHNTENHHNGYAELHYGDCDYDDIVIRAEEYEINKPTYDLI